MMSREYRVFENREEAGRLLALKLSKYKSDDLLVLAVPRGGVPIGYEIAAALDAPLDIIVAHKVGSPESPELAIGAVVDGDEPEVIVNERIISALGVDDAYLKSAIASELKEIHRRQNAYRWGHDPAPIDGKIVVLVDDGVATGASIRAAMRGVKRKGAAKLIVAVPVAPPATVETLAAECDDLVCLETPEDFQAVGQFYRDFSPTSDDEVVELLSKARRHSSTPAQ